MTRIVASVVFLLAWNLGVAQDLLITNARIIDGAGEIIERGSVLIADGRIVAVTQEGIDSRGTQELDADGMTLMPGLINTHWHVIAGALPTSSDEVIDQHIEEVVAGFLEDLLERGVTTIMSAGDYFPHILELRRRLADGEMRGPRLVSVGRQITAPDDWATQLCEGKAECKVKYTAQLATAEQARAAVRELAAAGVDALKLVYDDRIAPDVRIDDDVVAAVADEARRHGLTVFAHISTAEETALKVVDLGVRGLVHPVPFRSIESRDGAQVLRDLQIPVSTTISGATKEWRELRGEEFSEENEARFSRRLEDIKHLWDAGVTVAFGTDSVDGSSAETRFMIEARALNQVLSNEEVISTLTRNAAVYVGLGDELGTVVSGKIADIILIDGDPLADISVLTNAEVVIQGGRIVVDNR
ncbi:MAG: amidohydrolase family protein [Gemmatimonadales bacterium]